MNSQAISFVTGALIIAASVGASSLTPLDAQADQPFPGRASLAIPRSDSYPGYVATPGLEGPFTIVGSDSMSGLVEGWAEGYRRYQPNLKLSLELKGSATGPAALIEGAADVSPMARPMKKAELEEFQAEYGFTPTMLRVAVAAVGVYVPTSSKLESISLRELDAIFSQERRVAGGTAPESWGALNINGVTSGEKIVPISISPESPVGAYFRQQVLDVAPFTERLVTVASTDALIETLSATQGGIGIGELVGPEMLNRRGVKLIPVSDPASGKPTPVFPSEARLHDGSYPLGRYLLTYFVRAPQEELEPATKDFLTFILSEEGQRVVRRKGLIPISPSVAKAQLLELK